MLYRQNNQRYEYIDIAKGLLITLVVFGHAWRAVYGNCILLNADIYHFVDAWIYAFHMPAFFFLSGIFAMRSAGQPPKNFIEKKIKVIAYPYLLWSVIQSTLQLALSGSTTHTLTLTNVIKIPFVPVMQFWFLYALFFIYLAFILLKQLNISPAIFFVTGLSLFFLARTGYIPACPPIIYVANNFIYFSMGIIFANFLLSEAMQRVEFTQLLIFSLLSLFLACLVPLVSSITQPTMVFWGAPILAIPGVMLILLISMQLRMGGKFFACMFALLGRRSLEIFVAHTIFSAGLRIAFLKLGVTTSLSVHLLGASVAGFVGPLLLVYLASRFNFRYLFTWPSRND